LRSRAHGPDTARERQAAKGRGKIQSQKDHAAHTHHYTALPGEVETPGLEGQPVSRDGVLARLLDLAPKLRLSTPSVSSAA